MSALDELLQKHNTSALDRAVISFSIDYQGDGESAAAELLSLREELSTTKACLELSEGELRFTKSELTDAKVMLAKDADIFMQCFRALGLDVSGTDPEKIVDAIKRLKGAA